MDLILQPHLLFKALKIKNFDEKYHKFLSNDTLVKVLALVIAVVFVASVRYTPVNEDTYRVDIQNQQLRVEIDEGYTIVNGTLPETVTVFLSGNRSQVGIERANAGYEVYVDLRGLEPDVEHTAIPIRYSGLSSNVTLNTEPGFVTVTIAQVLTEEFPVSVNLVNVPEFDEGYYVGYILQTEYVEISGPRSLLNEIASVVAMADLTDVHESGTERALIVAHDAMGNALDVLIEPSVSLVTVIIEENSVSLPIEVEVTNVPSNVTIDDIFVSPEDVLFFGEIDQLGEYFPVIIDFDDLDDEGEIEVPLDLPNDVRAEMDAVLIGIDFRHSSASRNTWFLKRESIYS